LVAAWALPAESMVLPPSTGTPEPELVPAVML
jgi:hypothetical protein